MIEEKGAPEALADLEREEAVPAREESERRRQQRDERDAEWERTESERHTEELMRRVHQKRPFPFQ